MTTRNRSKLHFSILGSPKPFQHKPHYPLGGSHIKQPWHPNSYLKIIRNVSSGLEARTKILVLIEEQASTAMAIAKQSSLSYYVVVYHLRLLIREGTIERKGKRRYVWFSTGLGQTRLC